MTHDNVNNPYRKQMEDKLDITLSQLLEIIEHTVVDTWKHAKDNPLLDTTSAVCMYFEKLHAAQRVGLEQAKDYTSPPRRQRTQSGFNGMDNEQRIKLNG